MTFSLTAKSRTDIGRGATKVRNEGLIPAVVYGPGVEPKSIKLGASEFLKLYRSAGTSSLVDISVDESKPVKVLIQEVQLNPLTMKPQHVDFRQIKMDEKLTVEVPLVFEGEAPAVKELAGTLVHAYDALTVSCLPADLPHEIKIDLSQLKTFEDTITVGNLVLPKGVTVAQDSSVTLATVTAPLTEDQLKKLEEQGVGDVTAIKTESEEKKAEEEAKQAEEKAAEEASK